jgi:hypothetical protein
VPLSQRKQLKEEKNKIEPRDTKPVSNRNLLSFNMDDDMEEETPQSPQPTSTSFKKQNQKGGRRVRNKDTSMMMEEEKSGSSNVDTQMNDDT